ncbi:DUF6801 domain-containing protein [Actinomadura sp. 9N407]|uniref:DUF6801 domain-containing protein n=1 Tax=Actinomadura sp. 9N407 TaxID=3375154 RepID=UPI00379C4596
MRFRLRGTLRGVAVIGSGALLIGPASGGGTARAQDADVGLAYTCRFPSGDQPTGVRVRGAFPDKGVTGRPIQPGRITAEVTIPAAAVADLTGIGAASVTGTVRLGTLTGQNGKTTEASWDGLATAPTPVPGGKHLVLAASGEVPPVTAPGAGDLAFSAGALELTVVPRTAEGGATAPPKLAIACEPVPERPLTLATVGVSAAEGAPAPAAPGAPKPEADETPPECGKYAGPTDDWISGCVYMSGFSNVQKLSGATILNDPEFQAPALTNLAFALTDTGATVRQRFVRPIRSRSTFLTFGFVPTTATMELIQRPLDPGDPQDPKDYGTFEAIDDGTGIQKVSARLKMAIRISDVTAGGTPLNVGRRCETRIPADITLTGTMPNILEGGLLEGEFTIPAFRGCGAGEDLDPVFNGSVAGPDNLLRVTLGSSCLADVGVGCPPVLPAPKRTAATG